MADRGVSTVVSYVLLLGIVAILASALIGGFAPLVVNQQQGAAQSTLQVLGNDLAGDVESVDRLATEAGTNGTVVLRSRLPRTVAGSPYEITIERLGATGVYELRFHTVDFPTNTSVRVRTRVPVRERTGSAALDGGTLRVRYDPVADEVVVENA